MASINTQNIVLIVIILCIKLIYNKFKNALLYLSYTKKPRICHKTY